MCRHCAGGWSWACPWVSSSYHQGKMGSEGKSIVVFSEVIRCSFHRLQLVTGLQPVDSGWRESEIAQCDLVLLRQGSRLL